MPNDLSAARRAERSRARWTTYLLFLCVALDAVAVAAGLSQRPLLARLAVGVPLHPGDVAANEARHRVVGLLKLAALLAIKVVREIDRYQQRFHDPAGVTAPRY